MNNETELVMYVLVPTDLGSMNTGKAFAQVHHASNLADEMARNMTEGHTRREYFEWKETNSQGFGTVIVLEADSRSINNVVNDAQSNYVLASVVEDPTYPYIVDNDVADLIHRHTDTQPRIYKENNKVVLFRKEFTVGFVFGDKNDPKIQELVGDFDLHP